MDDARQKQSWLFSLAQWAGPLVLSVALGYGSVQYAQGQHVQKLATAERDITELVKRVDEAKAEHEKFPTREEFRLLLDDLKEIKSDVREIRRSLISRP